MVKDLRHWPELVWFTNSSPEKVICEPDETSQKKKNQSKKLLPNATVLPPPHLFVQLGQCSGQGTERVRKVNVPFSNIIKIFITIENVDLCRKEHGEMQSTVK